MQATMTNTYKSPSAVNTPSIAEMIREGFRKLGTHAAKGDVWDYVNTKYGVDPQMSNFSVYRGDVERENQRMKAKDYPPTTTTLPTEKPKNVAGMIREAFRTLGVDTGRKDILDYVYTNYNIKADTHNIGDYRREIRQKESESPKKEEPVQTNRMVEVIANGKPVNVLQQSEMPSKKEYVVGRTEYLGVVAIPPPPSSFHVVNIILLTRQAIEAAGGKDKLKELIDVL